MNRGRLSGVVGSFVWGLWGLWGLAFSVWALANPVSGLPPPEPFRSATIVITHDPADPLTRQLWAEGDPNRLWARLPAEVAVVLVPLGASPAPAPAPAASAAPGSAPGVTDGPNRRWAVQPLDTLPPAVAEGLQRYGHERRRLRIEGDPGLEDLTDIEGLGDAGIGRSVSDAPQSWALAAYGHDACRADPPTMDIRDRAVLIPRGTCPYVDKIRHAIRHGAAAVLFINNDQAFGRVAGACGDCGSVALAAVPKLQGQRLWDAVMAGAAQGRSWRVSMTGWRAPAAALRVGADGRVAEVGAIPYPFNHLLPQRLDPFESLAQEGVHLMHEARQAELERGEAAGGRLRVLPIFDAQRAADPAWSGQRIRATVALPMAWLQSAGSAVWDLGLACESQTKAQCPPWDYIATMHLCTKAQAERCEWEVGRWITPYWSGGRWRHDATPLLGVLRRVAAQAPRDAQGRALLSFEFHTIQPYRVTASLRLMDADRASPRPIDARPLPFPGGAMTDGRYSMRQGVLEVQVPQGVQRVTLAALITGHGFADAALCAEFCNTEHAFTVNDGPAHRLSQPEAGSELGCWGRVSEGVVPNQGGTWVYGRNGWCPGEPVAWREIDLSADVAAARAALRSGPTTGRLPAVTLRVRYGSTVQGREHHPPEKGADGRPPDARLDVTVYAVMWGPGEAGAQAARKRSVGQGAQTRQQSPGL